jgi:hypothetical protein
MITIFPPHDATEDEVAAALAAIQCVLADEVPEPTATPRSAWRDSGRLLVQDITPARLPAPSWSTIERLRRLRGRAYRA